MYNPENARHKKEELRCAVANALLDSQLPHNEETVWKLIQALEKQGVRISIISNERPVHIQTGNPCSEIISDKTSICTLKVEEE